MKQSIYRHGGDIYTQRVTLDFSVNVNPMGMPRAAQQAIAEGIKTDEHYPDLYCHALTEAIAASEQVCADNILCGNGASELIMALVRAVKPKCCAVAAPTFSGYEYALHAGNVLTKHILLPADRQYAYPDLCSAVAGMDIQMLFLCNPNNPVGNCAGAAQMGKLAAYCRKRQIMLVVDECFLKFADTYEQQSCKQYLAQSEYLAVLNAFTKFYAMAGIRLGYVMTANKELLHRMRQQLPEWNVSTVAQRAGIAALTDQAYVHKTRELVRRERRYLQGELEALGTEVFPAQANYLTFRLCREETEAGRLKEALLTQGILIRDCANYRNMQKGCYRIAVRTHEDNVRLIEALRAQFNCAETERVWQEI